MTPPLLTPAPAHRRSATGRRRGAGLAVCRRAGLAVCLSLALSAPAAADPASHRAAAEALLEARDAQAALEPLYEQARRIMRSGMGRFQATPERRAITERYMDRLASILATDMGWAQLREDYVQIYLDNFSEAELRELMAFYTSPIGRKMAERTPQLVRASVRIAEKHLERLMPKVRALSVDMTEELRQADVGTGGSN